MNRFLFTLFLLTFALSAQSQTKASNLIRYDGLYQTGCDIDSASNDTTYYFLRFYPNGKVISVSVNGTVNNIKKWFTTKQKNPSLGLYEIRDKRIYFTTTSKEGTVVYDGQILDNYYLHLTVTSLINGHLSNEKYYFVKVADLR